MLPRPFDHRKEDGRLVARAGKSLMEEQVATPDSIYLPRTSSGRYIGSPFP